MTRVIDFRVTLPLSEYAPDTHVGAGEAGYLGNYERVYTGGFGAAGVDQMLAEMDAAGVERAVLQAEWGFGDYRLMNAAVAAIARQHPDRFTPYVTVNPAEPDDMAQVVAVEVQTNGARGVNLQPFAYRMHCDDRRFYPLYETCQQLDIPVTVHCSVNFSADRPIDYGRPLHL